MGSVVRGLCFLILLAESRVLGARILAIYPYKGASHFYVFQPLMEGLAKRGHDVTVVSHHPRKEPLPNYRDISVADQKELTTGYVEATPIPKNSLFYENVEGLHQLATEYERILANPDVLALANSSFDVIFLEMFNSDLFYGLAYRIGAPVIGFSSCSLMPWTADSMAVPNQPAYIPNNLGVHDLKMDWWDRVINTLEIWASRVYYRLVIETEAQKIAEKYLGPLPQLSEIAANTSLLFVNTHYSLLGQRPYPPSVIEVGGISVTPAKPLPKDLDTKLNESSGAIYFSLGSVMVASTISKEMKNMFQSVFTNIGKTVLWKFEEKLEPNNPNIVTRPWFPQRDLLAHPKIEVFISHCGLLGISEAVVSGVPILCLPVSSDQPHNALFVEEIGIGMHLDISTLTPSQLESSIFQILSNKRYRERASEVSAAFRDRPLPPLETGIFWTEYLIRHGRNVWETSYKTMPLWQREGLDVFFPLVGTILMVLWGLSRIFGLWRCRSNRQVKVKSKNHKKKQN
uniref:UDP-glucuronosyltransferase n=1 Tax=Riptortus pedestris TaxID=329032 RepID=R4WTM3_RIPPE|nr:glucosyl/glucuronosyl transferases [Riptortus pedestris]